MTNRGVSVEVRQSSIRISFWWAGRRHRQRLIAHGLSLKPTPSNVRYAEDLAAEIQDRIEHGLFNFDDYFPRSRQARLVGITMEEQLAHWVGLQRVAPSTRNSYDSAIRFWRSAFGDAPLHSIDHSLVLQALAARPELSGKTVNNYTHVLRQALNVAVRDRLLTANPVDGLATATWQREPPDPFALEEVNQIVAALPEGQVRNMVEWRFFSGVRTSEMAGLRWRNVDLKAGYVDVREGLVVGFQRGTTKTGVARRVLLNRRASSALERQLNFSVPTDEHVWLDPRYGTPWLDERAFRRSFWTPTLKRLGIRYRPPNKCRHTYATMMLMAGRTPAWCARQLGHSVEMFLRTYSRWIDGAQDQREMAALEDWFSARETP